MKTITMVVDVECADEDAPRVADCVHDLLVSRKFPMVCVDEKPTVLGEAEGMVEILIRHFRDGEHYGLATIASQLHAAIGVERSKSPATLAEVDRLREALQSMADDPPQSPDACQNLARLALNR